MIYNAFINAISTGALPLNSIGLYSFYILALHIQACTPKARQSAGNINIPGDLRFTRTIKAGGFIEMHNV